MVRNRPSGDAFGSNRRSPTLHRWRRDDVNIAQAAHNEASDVDSESSPAGSPTKPTTPARWISGCFSFWNRFSLCSISLCMFASLIRFNLCRATFCMCTLNSRLISTSLTRLLGISFVYFRSSCIPVCRHWPYPITSFGVDVILVGGQY